MWSCESATADIGQIAYMTGDGWNVDSRSWYH